MDQIERLRKILQQNFYMTNRYGEAQIKAKYGIARKGIAQLILDQKGYCALCGLDLDGVKWAIDHKPGGGVRGILCYSCNVGLGHLGGTAEGLRKAIDYLKKFK